MKIKYIYSLSLALCLSAIFQSCESDVDFNDKESAPKMVINSIVNAEQETQLLKLSESVFAFGNQKPKAVENAELLLKINGVETPLTFEKTQDYRRYYSFRSSFKQGDKVEISAKSPAHNAIYGIDQVPEKAEITGVKTEWFTGLKDEKSYLRTLITIKDKPNEKNYYRIIIRVKEIYENIKEADAEWLQYNVHLDQEPLFNYIPDTPWNEDPNKYCIFSDELIDGKEYTLNVYVPLDKDNPWGALPKTLVKAEIHSLSENLFRYLRSVELAGQTDNFTEPVKIFSNIQNGYGILGLYNVNESIVEAVR